MSFAQFYYSPITELDRLFEDALSTGRSCSGATPGRKTPRDVYRPSLNLHESEDTNTVTATFELPGLTSDNITIDVQQNRLTVSGEAVVAASEEEKNYIVRERHSGNFSRTLQLPFGTKHEDVHAKMENGILTITYPKTSPEQQAKRIPIQ